MKAVLWTDSLQTIIIFAGLIVILIEGSKAVGGFSRVWDIANNGGRIIFDEYA